jgi:hypothetical protein
VVGVVEIAVEVVLEVAGEVVIEAGGGREVVHEVSYI